MNDPFGSDEPETFAERLIRLVRGQRRAMAEALRDAEEEPLAAAAGWLLLAIDRRPASVSELAGRLDVTKQAVSRMAQTLADLDLCERMTGAEDRREVILRPTAEGTRVAGLLSEALGRARERALTPLSAAEREHFEALLARLSAG